MSEKTGQIVIAIQTVMLSTSTAVLLAGVPWAYSVHGRVSSIEANTQANAERSREMAIDIKAQTINAARIDELSRRLDRLEGAK